eukprot:GILK01001588.1.p1 GENE.GILK01001588.1~~GILK01001588.1.p1  ORF type:complete len:344 (+),score=82.85 GILK01001588.1:66-1097(+)
MASLDDIERQLQEMHRDNEELMRENALLQSFLDRKALSGSDLDDEYGANRARRRSQKTGSVADNRKAPTFLSAEQKFEMAQAEVEELSKEIESSRLENERVLDDLKAILEETDIRIAEIKKDAYEFKRDIVVGAENPRNGKTMAERVVRYLEDKMREKDSLIEKLRLKNLTLKTQIQKAEGQLRQKEEMGDDLKFIDFHQLQIENKQYVAKIEEANAELLALKLTTGKTVQTLNTLKRKLNELLEESDWLRGEIALRQDTLKKIGEDIMRVTEERELASKENRRLKLQQQISPEMPQVLDYVNQKAEKYDLEVAVKSWERKLEIVEISAKRAKTILRQGGGVR